MAFRAVNGLDAETTITVGGYNKKEKKTNPERAEGYYLGSRVIPGSKFGDSTLHVLQTPKGNLGVWGKTDLDKKLRQVTAGAMVQINYKGTKPTKNGEMHTYEVLQDSDNTIEVLPSGDSNNSGGDSYGSEGSEESAGDDDGYEAAAPEPQRPVVKGSEAERKAKLDALLGKKK